MKLRHVAIGLCALLLWGCKKTVDSTTPLPGSRAGYIAPPPLSVPPAEEAAREAIGHQGRMSPRAPAFTGLPGRAWSWIPYAGEELWIISRVKKDYLLSEGPGTGCLKTRLAREDREVDLPLKHTDVKAQVSAYIATVQVTQEFENPYDEKIEAVYVFPLPENAAINEFVMTIGERRIRGIIREREEAEEIYQEARRQGYTASLLTQERPSIFTQSVANIEPGKQIDVNITYLHTLAYADGWYEFVFPMVVGPRFNPPGRHDGVGVVGRGRGGQSGQRTEVQYLRPNERSGHDIAVAVEVDAGVEIEEFDSSTHQITHEQASRDRLRVSLAKADRVPNKDFVLRYRVAGDRVKTGLLTHHDERGSFFSLMVFPPQRQHSLQRQALELVFVLDCSGSMEGAPIRQAKAAVAWALERLEPGDTFQVINFSDRASRLGRTPLRATQANIRRGLDYVQSLHSEGGTMMLNGIKAALDFPHDPDRLRFVCFLTDGYIGNEAEIFNAIHDRLGEARIFSFGVGSSVNRYLLDGIARIGRGAVAYLGLDEKAEPVMEDFFERISHPALTDVRIDWGGGEVADVFPPRVPDLFVGRPVILTGKFEKMPSEPIRIRGRAGRQRIEWTVNDGWNREQNHAGLPAIWARAKIASLDDRMAYGTPFRGPAQIKQLALDYNLVSSYTAFVAVDSSRRTAGRRGTRVPVAVPVPDGVRYSTTVDD
jgi:Ca-activated chloride channel homolog